MRNMTKHYVDPASESASIDLITGEAAGTNCYLLVDKAFFPSIHRLPGWRERLTVSLFAGLGGADLEEVAPNLLAIDPQHDAEFVASVVRCLRGCPAVSTLHSALTLEALSAHLASFVFVEIEPEDQRFALRFADTRVLPLLVGTLDDAQRRQFLGLISEWRYAARNGTFVSLPGLVETAGSPGPLRLSEQQFALLVDGSEADAVLGQLRSREAVPPGMLPSEAHARLVRELQRATEFGLQGAPDRLTWCALALGSAEESWWQQAPIATALDKALRGEVSLAEAVQEVLDGA